MPAQALDVGQHGAAFGSRSSAITHLALGGTNRCVGQSDRLGIAKRSACRRDRRWVIAVRS
jgi:hypothetical protein